MIRRLLFILFLYVLLVWLISAAYFYSTDSKQVVDHGILWTAVGVGALLLGLIVERLVTWWRQRSTARAANPETAVPAAQVVHEDDAALMSLLREADERLARAPDASASGGTRVGDRPLFLVVGPEGAGKTAVVENSGVEPSLLAGQVLGSGAAITSTRVANIWLAGQSVFLEVSGRVFSSDPARLAEFISVLQPGGKSKGWKSWSRLFRKPVSLRAVLLCIDSRDFAGTPEPSALDRSAQKIRERLLAISGVFAAEIPVYVVLTKLEGLPYFDEYFSRLSEDESGQVFGVLRSEMSSSEKENRVWAEAETKRLNKAFQSIFGRLSDRRLLALTVEPDAANKPGIYEFPREFKRIRTPLVQFLVDVFKPDPLKVSPRLRGFFFTGTKKVERLADAGEVSSAYSSYRPASDATQIFRPGMHASAGSPSTAFGKAAETSGAGQLANRWVFLTDLFHSVLTSDRPVIARVSGRTRFEPYRKYAIGSALGVAALLILIWTVSWIGNLSLAARVEKAVSAAQRVPGNLSLANLQTLDRLREQLEELDKDDSLWLHWGLSQIVPLRELAQRVYFGRLKRVSLDLINQNLVVHLQRAASEAQPTGATYDRLKTHRTITILGCSVDRPLISKVLNVAATEAHPGLGRDEMSLLQAQLDFYSRQLERGHRVPVQLLGENPAAVEDARSYLSNAGGLDQQLRTILNQIDQQVRPISVAESVDDYRSVLKGNAEIRAAFTKRGYELFDGLAAKVGNSGGEECVMGERARIKSVTGAADVRTGEGLKSRYLLQYKDAWKEFLASYSVIPYSDARDAAAKLGRLGASRSPLLGIVHLVAINTNFPAAKPGELGFWEKGAQSLGFNRALEAKSKTEKGVAEAKKLIENESRLMAPADLARLFQPVLFTTPPDTEVLVNDHNGPYVDGLRKLQAGLENWVQGSASEKPTAISAARAALTQARNALAGLADKFNNVGNEGVSKQLEDLLEQPIRLASPWIPANPDVSSARTKNGELNQFCRDIAPILSKYPFNPTNPTGASLNDVSNGFAPMTGKVWKYAFQNGADLVVRSGQQWDRNASWQGPRVTQELVNFLTQAQRLTNVIFTEGGLMQPLKYKLRPVPRAIHVRLVLDGTEIRTSQTSLEKVFYWPAQNGEKPGAIGIVDVAGGAGFGSYDDLWGVFRLFKNADERPSGQSLVQWSGTRGRGEAGFQVIDPPAKMEILEFPGGIDLFNPKFFEALHCPGKAVGGN